MYSIKLKYKKKVWKYKKTIFFNISLENSMKKSHFFLIYNESTDRDV